MKQTIVVFLFFFAGFRLMAQSDTVYQYTYGGIQDDICNQVKVTPDKGYIMIGTTDSFCDDGGTNFYAVKVDSLGRHQWSKTYGGNMSDEGYSVEPTFDHGYAFLGWTNSYGAGGYDVLLVKTDSVGNMLWQKTYGGSNWDFGYCVRQTADSGFVICGQTYSYGAGNGDVYVIRTDKNGDTLWTRAIGGAGYDVGNSVYVNEDSLYIIAGSTTSFGIGDTNMYLIKINNKGVVEFDTTYGCTHTTIGNSVERVQGGRYQIAAYTDSLSPGRPYIMVLQIDSNLRYKTANEWEMQLNRANGIGYGKDAMQCPDGINVSVGTCNTDGDGGYAMHISRSNGPYLVYDPYEGGNGDEEGNSLAYNKYNNNIVFAGATNSTAGFGFPNYTQGLYDFYFVILKNDTDIVPDNMYYHALTLFKDSVPCVTGIDEVTQQNLTSLVFPNPVTNTGTVIVQDEMNGKCFFSLYDVMGKSIIASREMEPAGHEQLITHFKKGDLQNGTYFYRIQSSNNKTATGKIIVE